MGNECLAPLSGLQLYTVENFSFPGLTNGNVLIAPLVRLTDLGLFCLWKDSKQNKTFNIYVNANRVRFACSE